MLFMVKDGDANEYEEIDFIKVRSFRQNIVEIFHKSKYRSNYNKEYYYILQMID
jgi:hypothetical protein